MGKVRSDWLLYLQKAKKILFTAISTSRMVDEKEMEYN